MITERAYTTHKESNYKYKMKKDHKIKDWNKQRENFKKIVSQNCYEVKKNEK